MITLKRLEEIDKNITDSELEIKGLNLRSPVSPNVFKSKNDFVSIGELRELVDLALAIEEGENYEEVDFNVDEVEPEWDREN